MATQTVNLAMTRGDTLKFDGMLVPGAGQTFAIPVLSIKMAAKRKYTDSTLVFELSTDAGSIVITQQTTSSIFYSGAIPPLDVTVVTEKDKKLLYDLQLTEGDGTISTPVGGVIVISPDVTPP